MPVEYKFYIGFPFSNLYFRGAYIDTTTGEYIDNPDAIASNIISISNNQHDIYINFKYGSEYRAYIALYDSNNSYIGYKSISYSDLNNKYANESIIHIDDNAKRIAFVYIPSNSEPAIIALQNIKNTQFLYYAVKITPYYDSLSKKYSKETGQEFFRASIDGQINLIGRDYELIKNSNIEDILTFLITKKKDNTFVIYYRGEFNKTDCKFDYDKRNCQLETTALDGYQEVLNKYENTYDLIKLAPEITKINMHKRPLMQVYISGANSISNFFGGIYWEGDVNEAVDSYEDLVNRYYFAYIKTANEFSIKGSNLAGVNGVYAGTNGDWQCWNGFSAYVFQNDNSTGWLYIKRNSDNKPLYMSGLIDITFNVNDVYLSTSDSITLTAIEGNGVVSGTCTVYNMFNYHVYRRLLCDVDTVEDSEGVKNTYDLPFDDFVTDNRNYKKCIGLSGGLFFCTSRTVSEPTKYGLNDYGQYFTNQFIPISAGLERPLPISRNSWANASLWYVYDSYYAIFEERLRKQYVLKDSYSIAAVIKALLKKIDSTITHEATSEYSQFLYGDNIPITNNRFFVYITQKTNILKGEYDQAAQKAEISLEEVMNMLRDCFKCYWYIEDNKFKIEHIYYFMNGGSYSYNTGTQLDFTKLIDQFNKKKLSYFQTEIEYDKSELSQRYEFNWMDDVTDLFGGVSIDVKSNYVQKDKTEEISIKNFSSDIDYMLFNPSNFSDDGFALLCPVKNEECKKYATKLNSILNLQTGLATETSEAYRLNIYRVGAGVTYRIIGKTNGLVTIASLFKDPGLSNLIVTYNKKTEDGIISYDEKIVPISDGYLAITTYELVSQSEQMSLYADGYSLPIVQSQLVDENGNIYSATAQNWYASWIYLINLYMYDMPAYNVECNVLNQLYVNAIKMYMTHTISFPYEKDLNEVQLIKTTIGNGKIDEISVNLDTQQTEVKLLYRP